MSATTALQLPGTDRETFSPQSQNLLRMRQVARLAPSSPNDKGGLEVSNGRTKKGIKLIKKAL